MKTFEEKIHEVVDSMKEHPTYIYENWSQANVSLDDVEHYPACVHVHEVSGTINMGIASYKNKPNVMIAFLMPIELDYNLLDKEDYTCGDTSQYDASKECYKLAVEFIDALNKSDYFKGVESVNYSMMYDFLDSNNIAIILEFELEETFGISLCDANKL